VILTFVCLGTQSCLQQNIHNTQLDGTSKAIVVRKSINEIVGFEIAYRTFAKAVDKLMGNRKKSAIRNTSLINFFQTSSSVYCQAEKRGASIVSFLSLLVYLIDIFKRQK
jgi:hypothetical protein